MDGVTVAGVAAVAVMAVAAGARLRQASKRRRVVVARVVAPRGLDAARRAEILTMPQSRLASYPVVQDADRIVMEERTAIRRANLPRQQRPEE